MRLLAERVLNLLIFAVVLVAAAHFVMSAAPTHAHELRFPVPMAGLGDGSQAAPHEGTCIADEVDCDDHDSHRTAEHGHLHCCGSPVLPPAVGALAVRPTGLLARAGAPASLTYGELFSPPLRPPRLRA